MGGWPDDPLHDHGEEAGSGPAGEPYGDGWHGISELGGFDHGDGYDLAEPTEPAGDGGHGAVGHAYGGYGTGPYDGEQTAHHPTLAGSADPAGDYGTADHVGHSIGDATGHDAASDTGHDDGAEPWGLAQPVDAHAFPPHLDLDVVPADGLSWVDVDLLGDATAVPTAPLVLPDSPQALLADLHREDGADGAPSWQTVAESDDPAVRALTLFWQSG